MQCSKALRVLLAFEREIRSFVSTTDQCKLSTVSWWLSHSASRPRVNGDAQWPTEDELNALTLRLYKRLNTGKRTRGRLTVNQVRVLLRDLLLVASGLRPSCLVDCCALTKELVDLLLQSLTDEINTSLHGLALDQIRAILLNDNVFFINADAFVHEKMATGLEQQLFVDVSATLTQPQVIDATRLQAFKTWTIDACKKLLAAKSCSILQWQRPSTLHATALAGILLCYPFVYDMLVDGNDSNDGWSEQKNCLALCPLVLVRTSLLTSQLELVLQEFSVPQQLLNQENFSETVDLQLQKHLQACCQRRLQRAIERSAVGCSIQPKVQVDIRSLPRVAL